MQDRPSADELLSAVEGFLDDLREKLDGSRAFHTRVAANAVRIVRRELENEEESLRAEWAGLDALLGAESRPDTMNALKQALRGRNESLCERIRAGEFDEGAREQEALAHLRETVRKKLRASDPGLLERSEPA